MVEGPQRSAPLRRAAPACGRRTPGRAPRNLLQPRATAGITLIELLVSLGIISLILAVVYPNVTAGLEGIRLRTSRDNIASLIYAAKLRADSFNTPVQVWFEPKDGLVKARALESPWARDLELPAAISLAEPKGSNGFILIPGVPPPAFRVLLKTAVGDQAGLELSPFLGVAKDWVPEEDK